MQLDKKPVRNEYYYLHNGDVARIDVHDFYLKIEGKDYVIEILRLIEIGEKLQGITFFLSENSPNKIPKCDKSVVLVLVSDEHYHYREYWPELLAVVRTYPNWPLYRDGLPFSWPRLMSFFHFLYKKIFCTLVFGLCILKRRDLAVFKLHRQMLHIPLGYYFHFSPSLKPIYERSIDYAFLGSVDYPSHRKKLAHRFLEPPKLASRHCMIKEISSYMKKKESQVILHTTGAFEESITKQERYVRTLQNCKISICPRGSNLETYRFFESCAAGCVVICEPLPDAWFYRNNPAITIRDWKKLPEILDSLLADPQRLQRISMETRAFWLKQLSEKAVADKVISFLEDLLSGPRGTSNSLNFDSPVSPNS